MASGSLFGTFSFVLSEDWHTFWSYCWSHSGIKFAASLQSCPHFTTCPTFVSFCLTSHFSQLLHFQTQVKDFVLDTLILCSCHILRHGVTIANMCLIIQPWYFTKYCWDNIPLYYKELIWTNAYWAISFSPLTLQCVRPFVKCGSHSSENKNTLPQMPTSPGGLPKATVLQPLSWKHKWQCVYLIMLWWKLTIFSCFQLICIIMIARNQL